MALRRVRSKSDPKLESVVSDEWIARFPDDWDVLPDEPAAAPVPKPGDETRARTGAYVEDDGYR